MIFCRFNECLIYTPYGFIEDSLPTQDKLGEIMVQSLGTKSNIYFCMPIADAIRTFDPAQGS